MAHLKAISRSDSTPAFASCCLPTPTWCGLPACGAYTYGTYARQMHIPDAAALLAALAPVLEGWLQASPLAALSGRFRISFYESGVALNWEDGALRNGGAAAAY